MDGQRADWCDGLPEDQTYRDEGCGLAPSCLNCPFPLCAYDLPGGERRILQEQRNAAIVRQAAGGLSVKELAEAYGLSRRSVQRILKKAEIQVPPQGGK